METPNKMIGGIAGAMAQQTGALDGATNLGVQPQQGAASVGPQQPPPVFNQQTLQKAQGIYGGVDQRQNSVGATPVFKLDPMHDGKPGVQKEDFEQFKK